MKKLNNLKETEGTHIPSVADKILVEPCTDDDVPRDGAIKIIMITTTQESALLYHFRPQLYAEMKTHC